MPLRLSPRKKLSLSFDVELKTAPQIGIMVGVKW
jgi:hypothetical protein